MRDEPERPDEMGRRNDDVEKRGQTAFAVEMAIFGDYAMYRR